MTQIVCVLKDIIEQFSQKHSRVPTLLRVGRTEVIMLESLRESYGSLGAAPERPCPMEMPVDEIARG